MPAYYDRNPSLREDPPGPSGNILTSNGYNWISATPAVAPIRSITVPGTAVSQIDIEDSFTDYPWYMIVGYNVRPTTANSIFYSRLRVGNTYQTTSYLGVTLYVTSASTSTFIDADSTAMPIMRYGVSSTSGQNGMFVLYLMNPTLGGVMRSAMWDSGSTNTGQGVGRNMGYAAYTGTGNTNPLTGIRFYFSGSTTAAGTFQLYGMKGA